MNTSFFVCFTTKDMWGGLKDFQELHRRGVGGVSAGVPILTSVPVSVDQVWRKNNMPPGHSGQLCFSLYPNV